MDVNLLVTTPTGFTLIANTGEDSTETVTLGSFPLAPGELSNFELFLSPKETAMISLDTCYGEADIFMCGFSGSGSLQDCSAGSLLSASSLQSTRWSDMSYAEIRDASTIGIKRDNYAGTSEHSHICSIIFPSFCHNLKFGFKRLQTMKISSLRQRPESTMGS